jgi:hypothetical protein
MGWGIGIFIAVGIGFMLLYLKKGFGLRKEEKIAARCSLEDIKKMREEKKLPLCFLMGAQKNEKAEYFVLFTPNKKFSQRKALFLDLEQRKVFSMDKKFLFRLNKSFVFGRIEEGEVVEKVTL